MTDGKIHKTRDGGESPPPRPHITNFHPMANGRIQIRVTPEIEEEANKIFEQMGMTPPQAIKLFLTQCVIQQKIPFPILGKKGE